MPGIVGIISQKPAGECASLIGAMVASMRHEPFYVSGTYQVPDMGIYAGWVAHEGSFAANQVFLNEDGHIAIVFSGECHVDPETVSGLSERGHRLAENEGSWLVHAYEEEGDRFFEKLNGLFSGLLIDSRRRKTFLFNDRYGVERVSWHRTRDSFYFASEAKALLRVLPELRRFDGQGVSQFLNFGCTLEERTLFRGISLLPGGSLWSFNGQVCDKRKYFSPEAWEGQEALPPKEFAADLQQTFKRVLPRYFRSESKIGVSLTGGLDSRLIMACRPDTGTVPISYTFSGEKAETLDDRIAARVAAVCGVEHQILRLRPDFFSNFTSHVDRTVYITDGYLGPLGAHEIYFNAQARSLARVRVTGVFGGELFRRVSMFKPLGLTSELVSGDLQDRDGNSAAQWPRRDGGHPVTFTAFREIAERRYGPPAVSRSQLVFRTPYLDNEIVALAYRTPKKLGSASAATWRAVEVNNASLANLPTDMGRSGRGPTVSETLRQFISKCAFKFDYLYSEGLPHWLSPLESLIAAAGSATGILGRYKFLHYRAWFGRQLTTYITESIREARVHSSLPWNFEFLNAVAHEHICGRKNYVHEINAVLALWAVERLLFRNEASERSATLSATQSPALVRAG